MPPTDPSDSHAVGRHAGPDDAQRIPLPAAPDRPLRIVFMGTPNFSVPCLKALIEGPDEVVGVVARPDKPAGRGRKMSSPPTILAAREAGIPTFQPRAIKRGPFPPRLAALEADLFVVVAYGRILPKAILDMPRIACINVHASLLPALRGAGPVQWAILRGLQTTGVTTMLMDEGMDTGDMLRMAALPIAPDETGASLHDKLSQLGAALLRETLSHLKAGTLCRIVQDHSAATLAPMLKKEDGEADWSRPAEALDWHVRGMYPWPGAYTFLDGQRLGLLAGEVLPEQAADAPPGTLIAAGPSGLSVATGRGVYRVTRIKPAGKRAMAVSDWLRGHPVAVGTRLTGAPGPDKEEAT